MSPHGLVFPLLPRRPIAGLPFGGMRSSRRGTGSDLAGSRPYRPGDDIRRIDRRASARLSSTHASDEFVVREHHAEEATRIVIVVDRRPAMGLFPRTFPWLHKPAVIAEAARLIVDSAVHAGCLVGYLDHADARYPNAQKRGESPFFRPPSRQSETWRLEERYPVHTSFQAPEDSLARALRDLVHMRLQPGSFVFLLSDFLAFPPDGVWARALARHWNIVPVVIQDPVWEQSFPAVGGAVLPLADPVSGRLTAVRLTRAEARARKRENQARLAVILERFEAIDLESVLLSSDSREAIFEAFCAWAEGRRPNGGWLR